jgi:hypothetical protein
LSKLLSQISTLSASDFFAKPRYFVTSFVTQFDWSHKIKIQKVQRPTNKSFYVNMPAAIAEALEMEKGEEFEWTIEDKNTLVLKRVNPLEIDVRINSK